jgi:hypothetical protein
MPAQTVWLAAAAVMERMRGTGREQDDIAGLQPTAGSIAAVDHRRPFEKDVKGDFALVGARLVKSPGRSEVATNIEATGDRGVSEQTAKQIHSRR